MTTKQKGWTAIIIFGLIILIDQFVKIYVKTHFYLGETIDIFDWWKIRFVENNGMAFGIELGSKTLLSLFRIVMVIALFYYLRQIIKRDFKISYILCITALTAGALGNIIDCLFYGLIFDESHVYQIATLFPTDGGYAGLLHGKVVDMLYFPLIDTVLPSWVPIWGGESFTFFDPVFNIADSFITVSICYGAIAEQTYLESELERLSAWVKKIFSKPQSDKE